MPHLGLGITEQMKLVVEGMGLEAKMSSMMHDNTEKHDELKDGEEETALSRSGPGLASWRNGHLPLAVSVSLKYQIIC